MTLFPSLNYFSRFSLIFTLMDQNETLCHLEICKVFYEYKGIAADEAERAIHMRTGLVQLSYDDFRNIYRQYEERAGKNNVVEYYINNFVNISTEEEVENDENKTNARSTDISKQVLIPNRVSIKRPSADKPIPGADNDYVCNESLSKLSGSKINMSMTGDMVDKLTKKKKLKKYFREMDATQKELDNQMDFMTQMCYTNENLGIYTSPHCQTHAPDPKIKDFYSEMDIEFRNIMKKVTTSSRIKDDELMEDLDFIEEYFLKHFDIPKCDSNTNKLAMAIVNIMRNLQKRVFGSTDDLEVEMLTFFKNRLYTFYNFYRK